MASISSKKPATLGRASVARILHPTDFSPACDAALDYARLLARLTDAELHVVHVVAYPEGVEASESLLRKACGAARKRLADLCESLEGAGTVTYAVRVGSPHVELADYVRAEKIDMVVMGTAGLRGDQSNPVGSTAEKLIRALDVPVLTVKSPRPAKAAGRVCSLCAKASSDVICDSCKEAIRGEAVFRKLGKD